MKPTKFEIAIALIDKKNSEDINIFQVFGLDFQKELLYAQRMCRKLLQFHPEASIALQIAARAQHICHWKIARDSYPMDRVGYLKWRKTLKQMHAKLTSEILEIVGFDQQFIDKVSDLIMKKFIKKNEETQILEDTVCLVFLDFYFEEFVAKHNKEKVIDILKKTWVKMSDKGHEAALKLQF